MNLLLQLILAVLAVNHLTELFRHGSLFERPRDWIAVKGSTSRFWGFVHGAVSCGFCFSHWIGAGIVFGCLWTHEMWFREDWTWSPLWIVIASAVIRSAQILNDGIYKINRIHDSSPVDFPTDSPVDFPTE